MRRLTALLLLLLLGVTLAACTPVSNIPDDYDDLPPGTDPAMEPELPAAFMVMVDNHPKARPQRGLDKADLVYEIVCETGITRFLAGFYTQDPVSVGPIRSIRYYYLQVARAYDLPLAHVGGNMDALKMRDPLGIKSICDITNASGAFHLDPTRSRPHSTYITSESVLGLSEKRGYTPLGLPELPLGDFPTGQVAAGVDIRYSKTYQVQWEYLPESGHYRRLIDGEPHLTADGGEIHAQNIIILEAPVKTVEVPVDLVQSEIKLLGQGKALFLRDGCWQSGTWQKSSPEEHFRYTLDDGSELNYGAGNVWVQQVHSISRDVAINAGEGSE